MLHKVSFSQGSSFSHLDDSFSSTPIDALMTRSISPGEINAGPGIALQMLRDMGWWWTVIQHEPLKDTEDTTSSITITTQLISDTDYDTASYTLHYSYDNFQSIRY